VVKIDPDIPFEVACLVGCGVTTGYGSATHTAQIKPGEDVAIVGVGGVGMSRCRAPSTPVPATSSSSTRWSGSATRR
jgi:Zn-dependent alcohol dehydrogenase